MSSAAERARAELPTVDAWWTAARIADALRTDRPLADAAFDRLYPDDARARSPVHWTPIDVARRAAELLAVRPGMRLLDVGAGVGKMCLVGALTTAAHWTGIERRADLCEIASATAAALGAEANTTFRWANFLTADWTRYDGFYLFNPIGSLASDCAGADSWTRLCAYRDGVLLLQSKLRTVRAGARVVTYHGIGGPMPAMFSQVASYRAGTDELVVWVRHGGSRRRVTEEPPAYADW